MKFTLQHKDPSSQARAGELQTDHGVVKTPNFMPVGTAATVKGIFHRDVRDEARAQIILANPYHLYLRPAKAIHKQADGVHRFSPTAAAFRSSRWLAAASSRRRDAISSPTSTVRAICSRPKA